MQKNHDGMDGKNTMPAYRLSDEEYARILEFKRDLHMHPELSRQEYATTEKIRSFLQTLPDFRILPVKTETGTGLAAQICASAGNEGTEGSAGVEGVEKTDGVEGAEIIVGTEGIEKTAGAVREIMLRADIDALPQTELYESPWKSRNEGVHACLRA